VGAGAAAGAEGGAEGEAVVLFAINAAISF
jgi:hypothetical protein